MRNSRKGKARRGGPGELGFAVLGWRQERIQPAATHAIDDTKLLNDEQWLCLTGHTPSCHPVEKPQFHSGYGGMRSIFQDMNWHEKAASTF